MRRALACALVLFGAPACTTSAPLDELIRFTDPRWCASAPPFEHLLSSLLVAKGEGDASRFELGGPDVPVRFRGQLGRAQMERLGQHVYVAKLPVRGTWQGLKVREVYTYGEPETDNAGFGIVFDATPAQVIQAANRAGFALPATGRRVESDELDLTVSVVAERGGAVLACGT